MSLPNSVQIKAFSKINLFLHILGRNEIGYHLLDSLFVFSDIGDDITITKNDGEEISLFVKGDFASDVPDDENNLVIKMCKEMGINRGISIILEKNVPVSSGIGGGSADAGAVMRGLINLFSLKLDDKQIIEISKKIGADVPACVFSKSSLIAGIGEIITPFDLKEKYKILLINPLKKILTKDIFKIGVKNFSAPALIDNKNLVSSLKNTHNDLLSPALSLVPEISEILSDLNGLDGALYTNMSGSGATSFALFNDAKKIKKAKEYLEKKYRNYWIKTGEII